MTWIRENELVIKNKVYHICPCCKMECKYCEEKESRRKFIHKMVTGINDDNDTTEDKETAEAT